MNEKEILRQAVDKYGGNSQTDMMIEEMSELTKALLKYRRAVRDLNSIWSSMIDTSAISSSIFRITVSYSLVLIYGSYKQYRKRKIERLERRLNE